LAVASAEASHCCPLSITTQQAGNQPRLPGLRDRAPVVDGQPVILGPYSPLLNYSVGPARTVGMTDGERKPMLHAKLLVLGRLAWLEYDTDVGTFEEYRFLPATAGHVLCPAVTWTPSPKPGVGCTDIPPSASSVDRRGRTADVTQALRGP
jgi:hypothetical protein